MTNPSESQHPIVPRERLDFGLDGDIPRYWFGNDPARTRFWDALSVIFPPGEKFFMTCVRDYRTSVTDPVLLKDIKDFNRQEAQHSMVHNQYNDRLRQQGIDVDGLIGQIEWLLNGVYRKYLPRSYTLAMTSALEHITALGAHTLFDKRNVFGDADRRVRAMYAWHAIEEVEHKGVAYDVMQKYAKVGYVTRVLALIEQSIVFPLMIHHVMNKLLIADGFSWWQRRKLHARCIWWLVKPGGVVAPMMSHFFNYFKPGYHPWDEAHMPIYDAWVASFERSGDPVQAGENALALAMSR